MNKKGWPKCEKCLATGFYDSMYDAYYCKACDEWLEKACSDHNCYFCNKRPDHPSRKKHGKNE